MDNLNLPEQWQYYISSWTRSEATEGIDRRKMKKILLTRNLSHDADSDNGCTPKPLAFNDGLVLKIDLKTAKIAYKADTSQYYIYNLPGCSDEDRAKYEERHRTITEARNQRFMEKMVLNNKWMKNLSQEEVQLVKEEYQKWKDEGTPPAEAGAQGAGQAAGGQAAVASAPPAATTR